MKEEFNLDYWLWYVNIFLAIIISINKPEFSLPLMLGVIALILNNINLKQK